MYFENTCEICTIIIFLTDGKLCNLPTHLVCMMYLFSYSVAPVIHVVLNLKAIPVL